MPTLLYPYDQTVSRLQKDSPADAGIADMNHITVSHILHAESKSSNLSRAGN